MWKKSVYAAVWRREAEPRSRREVEAAFGWVFSLLQRSERYDVNGFNWTRGERMKFVRFSEKIIKFIFRGEMFSVVTSDG